jgi:hypothetical protein
MLLNLSLELIPACLCIIRSCKTGRLSMSMRRRTSSLNTDILRFDTRHLASSLRLFTSLFQEACRTERSSMFRLFLCKVADSKSTGRASSSKAWDLFPL